MRAAPRTGIRAACVAGVLVPLAGCGSPAAHSPSVSAAAHASRVRASAAVTPGPLPTQLPSGFDREATHPDPNFDFGFVVQITLKGFQPAEMVAPCCRPIVWQNLTNVPQSITMDAFDVTSGPIPPGGSYVYAPTTAVSLAYHSVPDPEQTGVIDVTDTEP